MKRFLGDKIIKETRMNDLKCPKCTEFLCTEDIWCFSTVDPENIIIGIHCGNCNWYAVQLINAKDFVEFDNNIFDSARGDKIIIDRIKGNNE